MPTRDELGVDCPQLVSIRVVQLGNGMNSFRLTQVPKGNVAVVETVDDFIVVQGEYLIDVILSRVVVCSVDAENVVF
jgi:hypothetical protein